MSVIGTIYLLHLDQPLHHARHYLGWTTDLSARLRIHGTSDGARLLAAVARSGGSWRLVRCWSGDRYRERRMKRCRNSPRLCPVCNPEGYRGRETDGEVAVEEMGFVETVEPAAT